LMLSGGSSGVFSDGFFSAIEPSMPDRGQKFIRFDAVHADRGGRAGSDDAAI
jgi:hypothetical protein